MHDQSRFESTATRHGVLAMVGGVLWSVVLALDDVAPDLVGLAVVVPVLLGFGVLEIYSRYGEYYGPVGRAGVGLSGVGLGFLLVAILLFATIPGSIVAIVLVAIPGITGLVALALGSALLAATLYELDVASPVEAVLLGLGIPATPLAGALLAAVAGRGAPLGPVAPDGIVTGLSGAPYGIGWFLVGYRLREPDDAGLAGRSRSILVSPHLVSAGVVGGGFVLLSAGRFLPLGPLSGTPWVNQSLALDVGHLLVGMAGLGLAVRRDVQRARLYNRAVGLLSLLVVGLTVFGVLRDVPGLRWLARNALGLNVPDVLLHLPAGVVLAAVGFGISDPGTTDDAASE